MNNKIEIYRQHLKNAININNMEKINKYMTKIQNGAGSFFSKEPSKIRYIVTNKERFADEFAFIPNTTDAYFGLKVDWSYDTKPLLYILICIGYRSYYMPLMFVENTTILDDIRQYFKIQSCEITYSLLFDDNVDNFNIKLSDGTDITDLIKSFNTINKNLKLLNNLDDFIELSRRKNEFTRNIQANIENLTANLVDDYRNGTHRYELNDMHIYLRQIYNDLGDNFEDYVLIEIKIREQLSSKHWNRIYTFNTRIGYDNNTAKRESIITNDSNIFYNMNKYGEMNDLRSELSCQFKFTTSYSRDPYNPFYSLVLNLPNTDWLYHTFLAYACHKYFNEEYHISLFYHTDIIRYTYLHNEFRQLFNNYQGILNFYKNRISTGQSIMLDEDVDDIREIKNLLNRLNLQRPKQLHISMFNPIDIRF